MIILSVLTLMCSLCSAQTQHTHKLRKGPVDITICVHQYDEAPDIICQSSYVDSSAWILMLDDQRLKDRYLDTTRYVISLKEAASANIDTFVVQQYWDDYLGRAEHIFVPFGIYQETGSIEIRHVVQSDTYGTVEVSLLYIP